MTDDATKTKKPRGFATMDPEKRRELAAQGGRRAQASGNAHRWTSAEATEAGRRGGKAAHSGKKDESGVGGAGG